jgi:hypothetical protein
VSQPPLDQMSFGKPNRPSTPIDGVISNHYGEYAAQEINEKYSMQHELVSIIQSYRNEVLNCIYRRSK